MGHQNKEVDVESQQESGRRRSSCLDMFLVMSVFFLFVAVTAVAVGGLLAVMDLRSKLKPSIVEYETSKQTGDTPAPAYKMKNFAYLEAIQSELNNSTMQWEPVPYGEGTSVGSNFFFDANQHSLKPEQKGTYFMYVNLKLTCTFKCSAGVLSVRVGDKLTCEVELPANSSRIVSRKCWTVSQLDPEGLLAQMTLPKGLEEYWKLDLKGSGFGMFLVD